MRAFMEWFWIVVLSVLALFCVVVGVTMLRFGLSEAPALLIPFGLILLFGAWRFVRSVARRFRNRGREDTVVFDSAGVTRTLINGATESIAWDELAKVQILTTDEGPWSEDVYFLLSTEDGKRGCAVPQLSKGSQQLLERLMTLPGFDHEQVIEAMGCTSRKMFLCWERASEVDQPAQDADTPEVRKT